MKVGFPFVIMNLTLGFIQNFLSKERNIFLENLKAIVRAVST